MTAPDYAARDPRGRGGDPHRGAALGWVPLIEPGAPGPLYLSRVRLERGGYDRLGAYWGDPDRPLWWVASAADSTGARVDWCLRAPTRAHAAALVRERYPGAVFVRDPGPTGPGGWWVGLGVVGADTRPAPDVFYLPGWAWRPGPWGGYRRVDPTEYASAWEAARAAVILYGWASVPVGIEGRREVVTSPPLWGNLE